MNGNVIAWSSKVKHLGNIIDSNLSDLNDYAIRVADVSEHHVYRQVKQLCRVDVTDTARGIFDLLRARNNELYLHGFSQNDVEIMLNYLCTC